MNSITRTITHCARRAYCSEAASSGDVDIAFKPNNDGWGYNKNYGSSFDRIFGGKSSTEGSAEQPTTKEAESN
ncbi:hypothetical protein DIPPA_01027 [Diplonema papillatum]|nr:hypothetical protein DIPPA_01027 [Diplonema papillatum]